MGNPFSHLLLATERTEFDSGAESIALAMAKRCGLPLMAVIPLVSNPEYEAVAPALAARAEAEAAARAAALDVLAERAGVAIETHVRRGEEPWMEIVGEARERQADLVITRRRGKRGFLADLLVGDMVSKVAAHAPCNVLMVGRNAGMWSHGIVAAVDDSATGAKVISVSIAIAAQCDLPLRLVHVARSASDTNEILQHGGERADAAGVDCTVETVAGRLPDAVIAAQKRCSADLLVVGFRSDTTIDRAALGSIARKLIGLAETPVLIVKP